MEKKKSENILLIALLVLLVACMVFVVVKAVEICMLNKMLTSNEQSGSTINNNTIVNSPSVDEVKENKSEVFLEYNDVSYIENESLKAELDKIDSRLLRTLTLISLANDKYGTFTLEDVDKLMLHTLVINNFIEEDKYLMLENELEQSTVLARDYENIFTEISGINNVKEFFKEHDLKTTKDSFKSVYYEDAGKVYYIVPFGIGMEMGVSVISDITEESEKTRITIKTYDVDYENDKYKHIKTTTFEIKKDGLMVYGFNVQKAK